MEMEGLPKIFSKTIKDEFPAECMCIAESDFLKKRSELRATRAAVRDEYLRPQEQYQSTAKREAQNRLEKVKKMIPDYSKYDAKATATATNIVKLAALLEFLVVKQSESENRTKELAGRIEALSAKAVEAVEEATEAALKDAKAAAAKAVAVAAKALADEASDENPAADKVQADTLAQQQAYQPHGFQQQAPYYISHSILALP